MTDSTPVPTAEPAAATASPSLLDRFAERLVDRLNPILVREVRQAMNGRGFVITAGLALLATVLIGLFAAASGSGVGRGASVFVVTMEVLTPIVLLVVPLQAFFSTRQEVTRGTVEHLLLSRLTPGQIVRGKLAAATVLFVMYVAIFSPLLALTFLLRGVDVPTILYALLLALLAGLAASSLAVACGALSRWPSVFRVLPVVVLMGGLVTLTWGAMAFVAAVFFEVMREILRGNFWEFASATLFPTVGAILLCGLVGTAALSHPYENRSTGFRLFAFLFLGGLFAIVALVFEPAVRSFSSTRGSSDLWYASVASAACLVLFPLFAATEAPRFTPRVATRLPKNRGLRILSIPFLPGAGRGLLFALLLAAAGMLLPWIIEQAGGYGPPRREARGIAAMLWLYLLLYSGIGALVRVRLKSGMKANWIARAIPLGILFLAIILPLLADVILGGRSWERWAPYRVLDPFATIDAHDGHPRQAAEVLPLLAVLTAVVFALNLGTIVRGIAEVLRGRPRPEGE